MEQIIIIKPNGTKVPLFSKKNVSCVSKASQKTVLLSDDVVSISLTSAVPLDLGIGCYLTLYGKPYKLNQLPEPTKEGERCYTYELKLEGLQYDLIDVHYHLPEDAYGETYYSDLEGHLQVLMWNINRIYPGKWVLGEYPKDTEYKNITNSGKNSLQVLQELCSEYGVEFEMTTDGKKHTLNIKEKAGITHAFTLKYGRGKGLYSLQRKNVNNSGIITRLYVYGGTENLGSGYGHTRLCLPGTTRLTSYLEDKKAIDLYGVKEGEKDYDIKPQRIGTVTALGKDIITFSDSTMFDLNAKAADGKSTKYLIDGTSAKIKFESGGLAGYEFDLHSYDHATKTFVINKFQDENGVVFPSDTSSAYQIAVGDKYSISDIQLPDEFINEAEEDLKEKGSKYLPTVSQPQVSYKLELTESFFIKLWGKEIETEVLHVGDFIKVEDEQIGVNKAVRITQIERDLLKPHSYDITLSDTITKTTTVRVWNELQEIGEIIKINKLADPAKARRKWKATQELLSMVFDPEGDYYSDKIKPLSIETQMLSVGAKSTQFTLQNIIFQPNYGGDANTLYVSNGKLAHYAIEADGVKFWDMDGATFSNLKTATPYYIYAQCSKTQTTGNFILSETAKTVESENGYYNFLVGVLNSVITDAGGKNPGRLVSLTYGSSTVNGRFIRTGRIESSGGGKCYFDLDNDEIGGNIKFVSSDGSIKNVSDLETIINKVGKDNQIFTAQPVPPYKKGDVWIDGKDIKKSNITRESGNFVSSDWVKWVVYDNTQTVIDGGIVTSGTVQLAGTNGSILAGITGEGTASSSVRIWSGASKDNRANAPFRVLQDGSFVATKAVITGEANINKGTIGGFEIAAGRIGVAESSSMGGSNQGLSILSSFIKYSKAGIWAGFGNNVMPASSGLLGLCRLEYDGSSYNSGVGLYIKFRPVNNNVTWYSQKAISIDGNSYLKGGFCLFEDTYRGQAYTDIIESYIGIAHSYVFTSISVSYLRVRLPTPSQIQQVAGTSQVTFLLQIQVGYLGNGNKIKVAGQAGCYLADNNCNHPNGDYGSVDMAQGDSLLLRYNNGDYYIVNYGT